MGKMCRFLLKETIFQGMKISKRGAAKFVLSFN